MSLFSKQHYIWLASVMRDIYITEEENSYNSIAGDQQITTIHNAIDYIIDSLLSENPNSFDKNRFKHNIFCGKSHEENEICPYRYSTVKHVTSNQ